MINSGIKLLIVVLVVLSLAALITFSIITLTGGNDKGEKEGWKVSYLKKVYPLITNPTEEQFDKLEMLNVSLLPENIRDEYSKNVYTAVFPGPSCGELPCDCDEKGIQDVSFSPNPMLKNKWPPCNVSGPEADRCCSSVVEYKKCMADGTVKWSAGDTWTGNLKSIHQKPPELGQLWHPSLWPKFTLAVNKFPSTDWNSFYNAKGDPDNYWMEGVHSSFSIANVTYGVWFYRSIGSGMFVNLGRTIAGLNKIDAIIKLGMGFEELAKFIMRKNNGSVLESYPDNTGLGGISNLDYWLAGQYHTNVGELFTSLDLWGDKSDKTVTKNLVDVLKKAAYGTDYDINRICNTGTLDNLIVYLGLKGGYNSVQFTCQANLYNGFTTEVMILGPGPEAYTDIRQIPESQFRVMDPNNLPKGSPDSSLGSKCTYRYPFACVYCDEIPASKNEKMGCPFDISKYRKC